MPRPPGTPRRLSRLAWFVALYGLSVALFAIAVYALRALIPR
jgi:hypothetical protein